MSIETEIKIYSPSAVVHLNVLLLPSRETDPRCLMSDVIFMTRLIR